MATPIWVSLLGAVELYAGGERVAITAVKQAAIVAMLALDAGRVVSLDRLIDGVWGDDAPRTVRSSVQVHVSQVRRAIAARSDADVIVSGQSGYVLRVEPGNVDALRFRELSEQARRSLVNGDSESAAALAREALQLWTGDALSGLRDLVFAGPVAARLEDQRLDLVEIWADAEMACGRVDSLTAELESWVARAPYRESMWQRLILALYRRGRQADALERLAALRRLLRDELGVRPSAAIVELESAILDHDVALDSPPAAKRSSERLSGPGRRLLPTRDLIGRESLVDEVTDHCSNARIVTLIGSGGVGKTSVAVNVAAASEGRHRDGVWFVDLTRVRDGSLVATAIAAAVGLHPDEGGVSIEALTELLLDMDLLLVVDNCEHLVDESAEAIDAITSACRSVRVLATSRKSLNLADEVTVRVPALDLESAVSLLHQRALRVDAPTLSAEDERLTATLCLAVDRLPLGVELVAGRLRSMSVVDIVNQLDSAALLRVDARSTDERHRSLNATIKWSYDLLPTSARALLRRLAIFEGGAHFDAVLSVCSDPGGGIEGQPVAELLDLLVDASLAVIDRVGTRLRYRLLETVRAFALDQLDEPERGECHQRHVREMIAWGQRTRQVGEGPDPVDAFASIQVEAPNLRAAVHWCLSIDDHQSIVELVGAPGPIVTRHSGAIAELESWVEIALNCADAKPAQRLAVLMVGAFLSMQADAIIRERAAEALQLAKSLGDRRATAFGEYLVGAAHGDEASPRIEQHFVSAIELGVHEEFLSCAGAALNSYANLLIRQGRLDDAEALLRPHLTSVSAYGAYEPCILYHHARLRLKYGDIDAAISGFDETMQAALRTAVPLGISYACFGMAQVAEAQDEKTTAREYYERAIVIDAQVADRRESLNDRFQIIRVCLDLGDLNSAREHAAAIAAIAKSNPGPREIGLSELAYGKIDLTVGEVPAAQRHLLAALKAFAPTQMTDIFLEALSVLIGTLATDVVGQFAALGDDVRDRKATSVDALAMLTHALREQPLVNPS